MRMIKLFWQALKVFILFTGCTILFYYAMMWVSDEYRNHERYEEPKGKAVKVVNMDTDDRYPWLDRLILFYLDGE